MALRLRPLGEDEVEAFVAAARDGYADDLVRNAGANAGEARAKAERDVAALLVDGRPAEGHHLFVVEDGRGPVGRLWFAERRTGGETVAWVYDLFIHEQHRRRGLARETMGLLEDEARRRGLRKIALNVFGGNAPARALYRSLGYAEVSVWMSKALD